MLLRKTVTNKIGDGLIIWINPTRIKYYVGKNVPFISYTNAKLKNFEVLSKKTAAIITSFTSFAVSKNDYGKVTPIENLVKYQRVEDLLQKKDNYQESNWYRNMYNQIESFGVAKHKKILLFSKNELACFFNDYVFDLIDSMERHGYILERCKQIGYVMIGSGGEIHKSNAGEHRFIVAKILGVEKMPFYVKGVHEEFLKNRNIPPSRKGLSQLAIAIKEIEKENQ